MSSLETFDPDQLAESDSSSGHDYAALLLRVMEARSLSLRALALRSNVKRTRLAAILRRDASRRAAMTLAEFQAIINALGLDLMQVIISAEVAQQFDDLSDERLTTLVAMLAALFRGLPQKLLNALQYIDGMDGTEIRSEWGEYLQTAVVKRLVDAVSSIAKRRDEAAGRLGL
jgi:hypothetical protein